MTGSPQNSSADEEILHGKDLEPRFWDHTLNRHQEHTHQDAAQNGLPLDENQASEFTESDGESPRIEFTTLPRARTNIEAVMGLFAAFFIGLPAPIVVTAAVMHLPVPNLELLRVLSVITFFASGYLCVTVIRLGGRAVEGDRPGNSFYLARESNVSQLDRQRNSEFYIPLALAMAIRLPNWWNGIRPLIAIWWLCHFVVAAIFGHLATRQLNGINNAGLVAIPITLAVTMAFLFAANLYLMLAIAVGIPRPRVWLIAWRYRFVVDLIVTVAMIVAT